MVNLKDSDVLLLSIRDRNVESVVSVDSKGSSDEVEIKQREDLAIATILQNAAVPMDEKQYH